MDWYKVVDDKTGTVLLDQSKGRDPHLNVWGFAYAQIKSHPEYDVFIEVYEDDKFEHWVDSDSIVEDCERDWKLHESEGQICWLDEEGMEIIEEE